MQNVRSNCKQGVRHRRDPNRRRSRNQAESGQELSARRKARQYAKRMAFPHRSRTASENDAHPDRRLYPSMPRGTDQSGPRTAAVGALTGKLRIMDVLDALRLAPSADLYRLYLTIGRMINDPKRILEVRRHLHIGMTVGYVADDLTQPLRRGRILELRQTQAVVQDIASGRHWSLPYATVLAEPTTAAQQRPHASPPPSPPRSVRTSSSAILSASPTSTCANASAPSCASTRRPPPFSATRTKVTGVSPSRYCARSSISEYASPFAQ